MTARHPFLRRFIPAAILGLACVLFAPPWTASGLPSTPISSASAAAAVQAGNFPQQVLIIRHAEKPNDKKDPNLTSRGSARAAALPSLFYIKDAFRTKPAPFSTPDFIYATKASDSSNRPVETVEPLSKALDGMKIHHDHKDKDFQPVVDLLFNDKHAGKVVLICWHHGQMPNVAKAILKHAKNGEDVIKKKVPETIDKNVYDRVWQITFDKQGTAAFVNLPQMLLFKDSAE